MLAEIMASFSDCSSSTEGLEGNNGKRYSNSERTGSRKRILSGGYRRDSHVSGGEDIRGNFSNAPAGASGVRQYKGMVPQPNECRDTQICEKRQQVTFINGEDETAKAISAFKLDVRDANAITVVKPHQEVARLETRVLSVHSKGEIVEMLFRKHTSDEETGHSKNIDRPRSCSETEEEEEQDLEGSERIYNPGGGEDNEKASFWRREHMFEKVVTPSDVGKLNRLVIPKQHAEKYFPLDIVAHEKGLLLNFEDSTGKAWRFGYSYWNSSQSYVLTKGWSRFVKETKLGAGDIVSFDRATLQNPNLQRLFITWRRKPFSAIQPPGLPDAVIGVPLRLSVPFQFPYGAINYIGGSHGQQLTSSRVLIPQCMPFYWPANNISRDSDRSPAETRALQANAQPMDSLTSLHFNTTNDKPRKNILDPAFPFSIQRSLNCGRPAVDMESSVRTPPLDAIQLKSRGISRDDLSRPIENKVPEAAATSFHNSTSKKVVRLFGVDLECGKVDSNYEDELLIIPPSELLLARNSTFPHPRDQRRH